MPPASSKKRSSTMVCCVGRQPSARMTGAQILDQLLGRGRNRTPSSSISQRSADCPVGSRSKLFGDVGAQPRDRLRKFVAASGRFAEPERNRRRHAVRVLDAHDAALDALDLVAPVAELEDVAGKAFDREILIHGPDEMVFRFQQHLIVGVVGDGAARGQRGQPRAAAAAQHAD